MKKRNGVSKGPQSMIFARWQKQETVNQKEEQQTNKKKRKQRENSRSKGEITGELIIRNPKTKVAQQKEEGTHENSRNKTSAKHDQNKATKIATCNYL